MARRGALPVALTITGSDGLEVPKSEASGTGDRSHRFFCTIRRKCLTSRQYPKLGQTLSQCLDLRWPILARRAHPKSGTRRREAAIVLTRTELSSLVRQREPSHALRFLERHRLEWLAAALRAARLPPFAGSRSALNQRPHGRFRPVRDRAAVRIALAKTLEKAQGARSATGGPHLPVDGARQSDGPTIQVWPGLARSGVACRASNHRRAWPRATLAYTAACLTLSAASRSPRPVLSVAKNQSAISPEVTKIVSSRRISMSSACCR